MKRKEEASKTERKYYAYILLCADNTLYSGFTTDLKRREATHNNGHGAKYTRARRPVQMVYHETFATKHDAMHREAEFKRLTREEKIELIAEQNPTAAARIRENGENE